MVMTKGESMRKARNRAKLSATQLSRISGVPATTIYALERGTAARLCIRATPSTRTSD